MKTFFQTTNGLLRVGPDTDSEIADYDFFTAVVIPGNGCAYLFGLAAEKKGVRFTAAHYDAIERRVVNEMGLKPIWFRVHNGKVKEMSLPNKSDALNADGTVNHEVLEQHLPQVVEHLKKTGSVVHKIGDHDADTTPPPVAKGLVRHYFDVQHKEAASE